VTGQPWVSASQNSWDADLALGVGMRASGDAPPKLVAGMLARVENCLRIDRVSLPPSLRRAATVLSASLARELAEQFCDGNAGSKRRI